MDWLLSWAVAPLALFVTISIALLLASVPLAVWRARDQRFADAVRRTGRDLALLVSLSLIATLTVAPLAEDVRELPINLLPFRDQLLALQGQIRMSQALTELAANVVMFAPLGIALAWRHPTRSLARVAAVALVVSLIVEAVQAIAATGRQADVTDVLANVTGAVLGALIVRRVSAAQAA